MHKVWPLTQLYDSQQYNTNVPSCLPLVWKPIQHMKINVLFEALVQNWLTWLHFNQTYYSRYQSINIYTRHVHWFAILSVLFFFNYTLNLVFLTFYTIWPRSHIEYLQLWPLLQDDHLFTLNLVFLTFYTIWPRSHIEYLQLWPLLQDDHLYTLNLVFWTTFTRWPPLHIETVCAPLWIKWNRK